MSKQERLSEILGKHYMPPDNGDMCWQNGATTFTREEVAHLIWSQLAAVTNDLKRHFGDETSNEMFDYLDSPRIVEF